jgi:hypothetical protein
MMEEVSGIRWGVYLSPSTQANAWHREGSPAIGFGSPAVCVKPGAGYCFSLFATVAILKVDANGLPILPPSTATGTTITVPANTRATGVNNGFYAGRVYAPSATLFGQHNLMVFFCRVSHAETEERAG